MDMLRLIGLAREAATLGEVPIAAAVVAGDGTVLATAHAVSEGIVRGVNAELAKRSVPSTYNAYGNRNAPPPRRATPLSVSRSL